MNLLMSAGDGGWPYVLGRTLDIRPDDDLQTVIESHHPDALARGLAPIFLMPETRELVHLVLNAVLYATSAGVTPVRVPRRKKGRKGGCDEGPEDFGGSADEVWHLPGRIPISSVRSLRELGSTESGRRIRKRFLVRGHWRRPNPSWHCPTAV